MSELLKRKEWLTLGETAQRMTLMFQETVTEPDVLRLALDAGLQLSLSFREDGLGMLGQRNELLEDEWFPPGCDFMWADMLMPRRIPERFIESNGQSQNDSYFVYNSGREMLYFDGMVSPIGGIWDIILSKNLSAVFERHYWRLMGKTSASNSDAAIFLMGRSSSITGGVVGYGEGYVVQLWSSIPQTKNIANFVRAYEIPQEATIVVRTQAYIEFASKLNGPTTLMGEADKPLLTKERNTLYAVIAALLPWVDLGKDFGNGKQRERIGLSGNPTKEAEQIEALAKDIGQSVGRTTIQDHLRKIRKQLKGE